jgi:hypothetical protein
MMGAWLATTPVGAQEHAAPHEPAAHAAHGKEHFHRNFLGILIGGTYESEEKDTFFTLGVEYERLFNPRFAVVLGVEYISEVDALVLVAPFVYRHGSGLRLFTGPGLELKARRHGADPEPHGEGAAVPGDRLPSEEENLFLWRFGLGYNFGISERYTIAPAVDFDFVREDGHWVQAIVFAVTFGFDF